MDKNDTIEVKDLCISNIIPFQFEQLIHNLIRNALKFFNPDQASHVTIQAKIAFGKNLKNEKVLPDTLYCHISLSDNGIGFDQQSSENMLVISAPSRKNEYSGIVIGLSIVKKIVEISEILRLAAK
jgi:two-component system, chemotaxis family, CheB/CheR fusion protein